MDSNSNNKSIPVKTNSHLSLNCPRCGSSNTKFCYYNNYSLSQPRHFCRACKRYWTRGGSLRNVPIGGGCRKNRRERRRRAGIVSSSPVFPNPRYEHHRHQLNLPRSDLNYVDMFCRVQENPVAAVNFPLSRVDGGARVSEDLQLGFLPEDGNGDNQSGFLKGIPEEGIGQICSNLNSGGSYSLLGFGGSSTSSTMASEFQHLKFGGNPNYSQLVNYSCDVSLVPWNMITFGDRID